MPLVRPVRGPHYARARYGPTRIADRTGTPDEPSEHPGRVADITALVPPPFDVIGPDQRRALLERNPRNAVRLELSPEPDPHAAAAATLNAWLADGTLQRR